MTPRRIGRHVHGGAGDDDAERERRLARDAAREALSQWASGVTIVAVRTDAEVHALTVSAFMSVSLDPPEILVGLGPNAAAAPYLRPGVAFAVSLLAADQRALAARFADTFPVGPSPFPDDGPPVVTDAIAALVCEVEEVIPRADHRLVVASIRESRVGRAAPALTYHRGDYQSLE